MNKQDLENNILSKYCKVNMIKESIKKGNDIMIKKHFWEKFTSKKTCSEKHYTIVNYDDIIQDNSFKIIALVAPSSAGKDEIQKKLIEVGFKPIVSHTSRPMRIGETDGKEYHFITADEAQSMLVGHKFIEHRVYKVASGENWVYGISSSVIKEAYQCGGNWVVIVDFQGLKALEEYLRVEGLRDRLVSVYIDVNPQIRLIRSLNREGTMTKEQVDEVIRRYHDDKENVEPAISYCDMIIKNETKEHMNEAIKIIQSTVGE